VPNLNSKICIVDQNLIYSFKYSQLPRTNLITSNTLSMYTTK